MHKGQCKADKFRRHPVNPRTMFAAALLAIGVLGGLVASATNDPQVIGGKKAKPGEVPYQVAIIQISGSRLVCGGALLDLQTVLTAAHCVDGYSAEQICVLAGSVTLQTCAQKNVLRIDRHPDARPNPAFPSASKVWFDDIALLKLKQDVSDNDPNIATIDFVRSEQEEKAFMSASSVYVVAGWGLREGVPMSQTLYVAKVPLVDHAKCQAAYGAGNVNDRMICTGTEKENHCSGDSGGPVVSIVGGARRIVGVMSWGEPCGLPDRPGVDSRMRMFADWVQRCRAGSCT